MAEAGNQMKGVALVVAATLMFALSDVLTKDLATAYGVIVVVAMRYVVNLGLLAALLGPSQGRALWQSQSIGLVVLRGLCLAGGSLTMGLALRLMPVAECVAIIYLSPVLVMILARQFLNESVSATGWLAVALGFGGVLLISRPGTGLDPLGVALCFVNVGFATAYHLLTRVLGKTETMTAMLFHTAFAGTVVFWGLLPFQTLPDMPGLTDLALMGLLGALATAGHFLFTAAYREAPAAILAPINYLHLVWAALLGWVWYAHVPSALTLAGMAMVSLGGILIALRAGLRTARPEPEGTA